MGESLLALSQSLVIECQINREDCSVVRCVNVSRYIVEIWTTLLLSSMVSHFCIPPSCFPHSGFLAKTIWGAVHCSENCKLTSCHHADNTPSVAHPKFKCRQPSTDENQVPAVHLQSYHSCPTCLRLKPRWFVAILADSISYKPLSPPKVKNISFFMVHY